MRRISAFGFLSLVLSNPLLMEGSETGTPKGGARARLPHGVTKECPLDISGIADCPDIGCGENGDAELNRAKNLTEIPGSPEVRTMKLDAIRRLPQPSSWNTGDDRASIRGAGREGTPVAVKGFLLRVKPEGAESCNCDLTRRVDTDVHLTLVESTEDGEETSVTAEVTPRVRARDHPDWVYKNLKELEGDYIRVTGLLMLDTKHIRQSRLLPGERRNKGLVRATNWEVHPVTKLEVCEKSTASCDAGHGWKEF